MTSNEPPPSEVPRGTVSNAVTAAAAASGEFWLFGYGSLIFLPPPHYDHRIPGWVKGYVRRFWQAHTPSVALRCSEDHRGTTKAPGRVVTLMERSFWENLADEHDFAADKVWGVAYHIPAQHVEAVKKYLDIREINGYTIHYTQFEPADGAAPFSTMVYIGTPSNPQFVGPQDVQALAEHIFRSKGDSGTNKEYLWSLEKALNELSPDSRDDHVTDLSNRVRVVAERWQQQQQQQQQ
ncbi:ChaC-like protein [Niveomyces insectorum RCEF 264]|uniref:glutathione-specific gamma-glutamylcyclotransferase n=1 Tax=Niveomyces insectorum RCEF 264 TaxID=1081102 RepID=A0A167PED6_9HYPO|nr:ChaC-like protein [Niveomyces insectorum RCEF 264]